jgi:hypothetical protein
MVLGWSRAHVSGRGIAAGLITVDCDYGLTPVALSATRRERSVPRVQLWNVAHPRSEREVHLPERTLHNLPFPLSTSAIPACRFDSADLQVV